MITIIKPFNTELPIKVGELAEYKGKSGKLILVTDIDGGYFSGMVIANDYDPKGAPVGFFSKSWLSDAFKYFQGTLELQQL